MGISSKSKVASVAVSALLATCLFAPTALANDAVQAAPAVPQVVNTVKTQAGDNNTFGTAKKIKVGKAVSGRFNYVAGSTRSLREYWYWFKTANFASYYTIRLTPLGNGDHYEYVSLYDENGRYAGSSYTDFYANS